MYSSNKPKMHENITQQMNRVHGICILIKCIFSCAACHAKEYLLQESLPV